MKKIVAATAVLAILTAPALAQMTGAPAAAQSDPSKSGMGSPDQGAITKGKTGSRKNKASKKNMQPREDVTKNSMSK